MRKELKHSTQSRGSGLCSSPPRGDGNCEIPQSPYYRLQGLCSSPPRGDGNRYYRALVDDAKSTMVYTAQPREGTETRTSPLRCRQPLRPGLCSSTPRGDGNDLDVAGVDGVPRLGLCILTPRGDESGLMSHSRGTEQLATLDLYAHDDTPPCSSPVSAPHAQHISSFLMGGLW